MHHPGGRPFGNYLLFERLAMGGMAELFRAQRVGAAGFAKPVAIKRIHPEYSQETDFVRMFINEANIAALLTHPNIVQIFDFDLVDGCYYIAMELIEGITLKELQQHNVQQPLPLPLLLWPIAQTLKALDFAHHFTQDTQKREIIHRDVSPHNILLSQAGEVKLSDFGIARFSQGSRNTAHGIIKGKASYIAPEQTHDSHVDARADLFSLGVILWELLTRQRLFRAEHQHAAIEKVRHQTILPPRTLSPQLPAALDELTMWALQRDLEERIPDAKTFLRGLLPFLDKQDLTEDLAALVIKLNLPSASTPAASWHGPPPAKPLPPTQHASQAQTPHLRAADISQAQPPDLRVADISQAQTPDLLAPHTPTAPSQASPQVPIAQEEYEHANADALLAALSTQAPHQTAVPARTVRLNPQQNIAALSSRPASHTDPFASPTALTELPSSQSAAKQTLPLETTVHIDTSYYFGALSIPPASTPQAATPANAASSPLEEPDNSPQQTPSSSDVIVHTATLTTRTNPSSPRSPLLVPLLALGLLLAFIVWIAKP